MKVLLLGGGGFLSSAVEHRLAADGHRLTVLSRGGRTAHPASEACRGERHDAATLRGLAAGGFDAAVDFLAFSAAHAREVVEAFRGRLARVVLISTGSVYWCTGEWTNPVGEDQYPRAEVPERPPTALTPGSIEHAYGLGKRGAEDVLEEATRRGDLAAFRLRFPVVGGPGDPTGRYAGYLERLADGGPIVVPDGGFNSFRHLYVEDAAAAVAAALDAPEERAGAYNAASAEIVSVRDLLRLMAEAAGRPEPEVVAAPCAWLAARGLGDLFAPFSSLRDQILDMGRAVRDLGFAPTPLGRWLAETVRQGGGGAVRPSAGPPRPAWRPRAEEIAAARELTALLANPAAT